MNVKRTCRRRADLRLVVRDINRRNGIGRVRIRFEVFVVDFFAVRNFLLSPQSVRGEPGGGRVWWIDC